MSDISGVIVISPTGSISGLFRLALLHKVPVQEPGVQLGESSNVVEFPNYTNPVFLSFCTNKYAWQVCVHLSYFIILLSTIYFSGYTVAKSAPGFTSYSHPETVLLLHTSGTSGNKKLVPYSLDMVIVGKTKKKN